jgi:hypothetical protein
MTDKTLADWVSEHRAEVRLWSAIAGQTEPSDCLVDACTRPVWRVGLCRAHTWRAYRAHQAATQDLGAIHPAEPNERKKQ